MSSIENIISEIDDDYDRLLRGFQNKIRLQDGVHKFGELTEEYIVTRLRGVMKLQRKIEGALETVQPLAKHTRFSKRLNGITSSLLDKLYTDSPFDSIVFTAHSSERGYYVELEVIGVIPLLRKAHKHFLHTDIRNSRRYCYLAYFALKCAKSNLIELDEEFRLTGALTSYPINQKTRLKHSLIIKDFEEVVVSLEEAESNVEPEHFKDCVSRCRDALEIFVASVREKEIGEKTERRFSTDLGKIVKIGIFDEATRKLAQGIYSFLSLKGSHKYNARKVSIYDAETSLKETYSLLQMLMKKYSNFKKGRK